MAISIGIGNYIRSSLYRGTKKNPFHPSLVDYWNFAGKKNSDTDRAIIKGINGNILNAYNFGWALGSGYGLYKEDYNSDKYRKFKGSRAVFTTTDNSIHITESLGSSSFIETKNTQFANAYSIKVTGLKPGIALEYRYVLPDVEGLRTIAIVEDGVYNLPQTGNYFNGLRFTGYLGACNITIKQIPEYEGAIVTDGIDDYLKLNKVGYKVRTIIIKFKPINIKPNVVNAIVNIHTDEVALQYDISGVINSNFTTYKNYEEYGVGIFNIDKNAVTPLTLGCKLSNSGSPMEYSNVAIYSVAIYQNVLTAEEIQKEINVMEYDTPNPVFVLNFDNFAYKAVDYPDFATGKVTTNKIVVDSTTETFNGAIAVAMNPEADTGDPIEVPSYKIKVTGLNQYSVGEDNWAVGLMGMMIDSTKDPWTYTISKDGVYDIPAISLSDGIYNLGIMAQIAIDKPIEIEVLYDKNITKSFPENKQIFP
jgi:hypothetical protein